MSDIRVLAMFLGTLFVLSSCAPMTSVRNGLENQSKLRDEVTGRAQQDLSLNDLKQEESQDKIDKIAEFEKMLLAAKTEEAEIKKQIEEKKNSRVQIIKSDENADDGVAVAGAPSRDDVQDENISKNGRKLLTFKEQFSSLESKHERLKTKVEQIENELNFLRDQVIALNSKNETYYKTKPIAKKTSTKQIIESEETIAALADKPKSDKADIKNKVVDNAQLELAEQFYNKGKYKDAIVNYEQAIEGINSNKIRSEILYKVAMSHYNLKAYEKSIEYFDKVCSLAKNMYMDDAQIQIAEANMRLGKIDEAKKAYKNILAVYPKSKHIPKARKMLQQL